MKVATIDEVQSKLKSFLRSVEQGEEIEIRRRNKPVARIVPIQSKHVDWSDVAKRLRRIYGQKVVGGKHTHAIVAEGRGDH
jgi:prevent-host-death family protein